MIKNLTMEERDYLEKVSTELKTKRALCRKYCSYWNGEDGDCEIFGSRYSSPSTCQYYLIGKLEEFRNKQKKGQI